LNKSYYPEESLYGHHITYITLDISYKIARKVRVRKIHKDYEMEELNLKYKINDDELYLYDNQIDLDVFWGITNPNDFFENNNTEVEGNSFYQYDNNFFRFVENRLLVDNISFLLKDLIRYDHGLRIYVGMKNPDEKLNNNLCNILNQLCIKYLRPGVMFTSREGIICKIQKCHYTQDILKKNS